ncbi:MAG TPA: phosphate ABC transporter substrate-binding protein PstS [Acidimicrobiales bacterium]|nr:phosphate ABC transporter substrate-binding protein PstS [Acidimicrobiales bacterium]
MSKRVAAAALAVLVPLVAGAWSTAGAQPRGAQSRDPLSANGQQTGTTTTVTLDGAGANSIDPFFESVFYAYHKTYPKVTVNYDPAGSSVGVSDIQQQTVDFGDTEIPMSAKDLAKAKGRVLQVPVDLGGVAISYNVPGAPKNLKLDGPTLAGIFDGTITNWDSKVIADETGVSNLPDLPIIAVHRSDTSGPGWDLDEYLIQTSPDWVSVVKTTKASKAWPVMLGVGAHLNSGVATYIAETPGAIGYVEYGYALKAGFATAAIKNAAGNYIIPSEPSLAKAGVNATKLSASNFSIINSAGATTYPIANFSWTLLYQKQPDLAKAEALKALFEYVVTAGQAEASELGYAPLPTNVVQLAESTLNELETSAGKPVP